MTDELEKYKNHWCVGKEAREVDPDNPISDDVMAAAALRHALISGDELTDETRRRLDRMAARGAPGTR